MSIKSAIKRGAIKAAVHLYLSMSENSKSFGLASTRNGNFESGSRLRLAATPVSNALPGEGGSGGSARADRLQERALEEVDAAAA